MKAARTARTRRVFTWLLLSWWSRALHSPANDRSSLELAEQRLEEDADDRDRQKRGEDLWRQQVLACVVDVVAEPARAAGDAEDELGGDDRAPAERPGRLETRDRVRQRGGGEHVADHADACQANVPTDCDERRVRRREAGVERDRDRPDRCICDHEA